MLVLGTDHRALTVSDRLLRGERFSFDTGDRKRGWYREGNRIVASARTRGVRNLSGAWLLWVY